MVARADILAGRAVIFIDIQDTIDKQLRSIRNKMRMFSSSIAEVGADMFRGGLAATAVSSQRLYQLSRPDVIPAN